MSNIGLNIYDSNGKLLLDTNDLTFKVLGSFTTDGSNSGSHMDSRLSEGTPWAVCVGVIDTGDHQSNISSPFVNLSPTSTAINWSVDNFDYVVSLYVTVTPPPVYQQIGTRHVPAVTGSRLVSTWDPISKTYNSHWETYVITPAHDEPVYGYVNPPPYSESRPFSTKAIAAKYTILYGVI